MKLNRVLVADIGGTNVRFAIAEIAENAIRIHDVKSFRTGKFDNIFQAVESYIHDVGTGPTCAAFSAAGPVVNGEIKLTNSNWPPLSHDIAGPLNIRDIRFVNDFYAQAAGVDYVPDDAFVTIKSGVPVADAPQLIIGPGTGLGQAIIAPAPQSKFILATEGGHCSFGARTADEFALLKEIRKRHNPVCVEHIVSGEGIANVYAAFRAPKGGDGIRRRPGEITAAARSNTDPDAVNAIDFFAASLGRVAGDAALATGARGGVILSGGVLPKIRDVFSVDKFIEQFCDKGRMSEYVNAIPVRLVVDDRLALFGAASEFAQPAK